jgi:nucleotide-binding universal stress UspA family protein
MPRSILIGLDGSDYSTAAVDLCIGWAKRFDCLLIGMGIVDTPTIDTPSAVPVGGTAFKEQSVDAQLADARRQVEQFLEQFALKCIKAQVSHKLLENSGVPSDEIARQAQRYDMIVLGQETYFHFETQDQPGDTLEHVLRAAPRPVVAVPSPLRPDSTSTVIAFDGSLPAARALQMFQQSGLAEGSGLHVLSAHSDQIEAARLANIAIEFLQSHDLKAETHAETLRGAAATMITDKARELDAALIVMGAYGQNTIREFLLGSTTRSIISDATTPLFLYH